MENPKLFEGLVICNSALIQASRLSKELASDYKKDLAVRVGNFVNENYSEANYEEKKEKFVYEILEEIKNL